MTDGRAAGHGAPPAAIRGPRRSSRRSRRPSSVLAQFRKSPLAIAGGVVLASSICWRCSRRSSRPTRRRRWTARAYFHPPQRAPLDRRRRQLHLRPVRPRQRARRPGQLRVRGGSGARAADAVLRARRRATELLGVIPSTGTCSASMRRAASSCSAADRSAATCSRGCCTARRSRSPSGSSASRSRSRSGCCSAASRLLRRLGRHRHHARRPSCCSAFPSLYLIIALRAVFPIDLPSQQVYLGIVAILAFIGWAAWRASSAAWCCRSAAAST